MGRGQGTTEAAFLANFATGDFEGDITFTTNRATLTVTIEGNVSFVTGAFLASGDVTAATGKLEGASGSLRFEGVQMTLADPAGSFTETVTGEICVDLKGDG